MSNLKGESIQWVDARPTIVDWNEVDGYIQGVYIGYDEKQTKVGVSKLYKFRAESATYGVWGTTILDDTLTGIAIGSLVRIAYKGMAKTSQGQEFHDFDVKYQTAIENYKT